MEINEYLKKYEEGIGIILNGTVENLTEVTLWRCNHDPNKLVKLSYKDFDGILSVCKNEDSPVYKAEKRDISYVVAGISEREVFVYRILRNENIVKKISAKIENRKCKYDLIEEYTLEEFVENSKTF